VDGVKISTRHIIFAITDPIVSATLKILGLKEREGRR